MLKLQDSPELILVLFPDIRPFLSAAAKTEIIDLGNPIEISCPAHGASYGAVYTWSGAENIEFPRSSRRAISPTGELFIMFVTEEDITLTEQLKGISCTMTGGNAIYRSGAITLRKRQQGNDLLYYSLFCLTVGCCGMPNELDSVAHVQVRALAEVFVFHLCSWKLLKVVRNYGNQKTIQLDIG